MPGPSRIELYAALRRDAHAGLSNRALQRKYGVTWSTVNKALTSVLPQPRAAYAPRASKLDPFKPLIMNTARRAGERVTIRAPTLYSG